MTGRRMWTTGALAVAAARLTTATLWAQAATGQFQAADSLPAQDQVPAAPLLVGAYAFVLVALVVYVWLLWRRLAKVEREMSALAARQRRSEPRS